MCVYFISLILWLAPATLQGEKLDPVVSQLIGAVAEVREINERIELISAGLLGRPYLTHPLVGSPETTERLVTRVDGFDCVTFVETVLALAYADSPADFTRQLISIRYRDGHIDWTTRLHYATEWSAYNVERRLLDDLTGGAESRLRQHNLYQVRGLDPRPATYHYYPKRTYPTIAPTLMSGDIIFFVSGRPGLDTNHLGIVISRNGQLLLRNASRRQRAVVDEPLDDYVRANRMAGFIINRPRSRAR